MKRSLRKGVGFGLTSGVITTLGVMTGLNSGTQSRIAVLAGIAVLAISDALSDAMGIHVSEEAEMEHTPKEVWEASAFTFLSKLFITLTFTIPIIWWKLGEAVIIDVFWGVLLVAFFSFWMAKTQQQNPYKVAAEHVTITVLVILAANYLGVLISQALST